MRLRTALGILVLCLAWSSVADEKLPSGRNRATPAPATPARAQAPPPQLTSTGAGDAVFSHGEGHIDCGGRIVAGTCELTVDEGAPVSFRVVRSLPGLLRVKVEKIDREPDGLSEEAFLKLVGSIPGAPAPEGATLADPTERVGRCGSRCASPAACFVTIEDALKAVKRAIRMDLNSYERAFCTLVGATAKFVSFTPNVNPDDTGAVFGALAADAQTAIGEARFRNLWPNLRHLLDVAPDAPVNYQDIYQTTYKDRDFDLKYSFEVADAELDELIDAPGTAGTVFVQLRDAWGVQTSTALMASGLIDDVYTTRSVTTSVDGADVTRNVAVREDRDIVAPELAFLISLFKKEGANRHVLSVGLGMGPDSGGRMYATYGRRLGQAGAWHVGLAIGKVKRLSRNVNVDDLGDVDPNASRRDVVRPSFTVGVSWRILD